MPACMRPSVPVAIARAGRMTIRRRAMPRCHSLLRHWPKRFYEEAFCHHAGYNSDRIPGSRGRDVSIVVVVEDEPSVRIAAERILRRAGHEVLSASSVSEALSIIESDRSFDLL